MFKRFFTFAIFCFTVTEFNPFWMYCIPVYERVKGLEHPTISTTIKQQKIWNMLITSLNTVLLLFLFIYCFCVAQFVFCMFCMFPLHFNSKRKTSCCIHLFSVSARQYHHLHIILSSIFSLNPTQSFSTKHRILEYLKNDCSLEQTRMTRQKSHIIVLMDQTVSV